MKSSIFLVLCLLIILSKGSTIKFKNHQNSNDFQSLNNALIHILKSCDVKYDVIMIYHGSDGSITKPLLNLEPLSTIILYRDSTITKKRPSVIKKIDAIIIVKESLEQLTMMIDVFSKTPWWNVLIPYFILEQTTDNNHTIEVLNTFEFFLKKDISMPYFIKSNGSSIDIITMNPFAKWAPSSWSFLATLRTQSSLYTRPYHADEICEEFYFDRTQYIHGHRIKMLFIDGIKYTFAKSSFTEKNIDGLLQITLRIFVKAIRDTLKLKMDVYTLTSLPYNWLLRKEKYVYEQTDISIVFNKYWKGQYFDRSRPTLVDPLNLLVNQLDYLTLFQNLQYSYKTIFSIITILLVIFIFIRLINCKKSPSLNIFKLLRLIVKISTYSKIVLISHELIHKTIIILLLFIHITFLGNLLKSLIKSDLSIDIQMLGDLRYSKYSNICYTYQAQTYFKALGIKHEKLKFCLMEECLATVSNSKPAVCAYFDEDTNDIEFPFLGRETDNFYILPKNFGFRYQTFYIRRQWSLKSRINKLFANIFESDLNYHYSKIFWSDYRPIHQKFKVKDKINMTPINLNMLIFAFVILGIGLTGATISFLLEKYFFNVINIFLKSDICKRFYFDRTQHLNGHKIKLADTEPFPFPTQNYTEIDIQYFIPGDIGFILPAIADMLNITMELQIIYFEQYYNLTESDRYIFEEMDIKLLINRTRGNQNRFFDTMFPTKLENLYMIIHHRGYKTLWEKIQDYYGIWTLSSMIVILLIAFVAIRSINYNKNIAFVVFEILRLLTNTGIFTNVTTASRRIFFSVIFLYFFIIHSTFSGHLVDFLTKSTLRKNIEDIEELKNSEYQVIFYTPEAQSFIKTLNIEEKRLIKDERPSCLPAVVEFEHSVCVGVEFDALMTLNLETRLKKNISVLRTSISFYERSFYIRKQWSLNGKVNSAYLFLSEFHLKNSRTSQYYNRYQEIGKRREALGQVNFTPINLSVLNFAFVILGICLVCATVSFIIEIKYANSSLSVLFSSDILDEYFDK